MVDYENVIRLEPENVAAHCNLGVIKNSLGKFDEALVDLDCAVRLCPDDMKALNNRAATYRELGRPMDAVGDFRRAILVRPDVAEVHYNLGMVLAELSDLREARINLLTALGLAERGGDAGLVERIRRVLGRIGAQ